MGEPKDKHVKVCLKWILMLSLSPIALLLFMLVALFLLLQFLCKVALLFTVVVINTPFLVMYNLSVLVFQYNLTRFQIYYKPDRYKNSKLTHWNYSDPRASLGVEVKILVSDFLKVVGGELLLTVSTAIITYYTAPLFAFYITLIVGVIVTFHNWLNSDCVSKTALSCLCDGYGLSPLMFLFSFVGLFDIGCHPVAKCSFAASLAYLFVKDEPNTYFVPDWRDDLTYGRNPNEQTFLSEEVPKESTAEEDDSKLNENDGPVVFLKPSPKLFESRIPDVIRGKLGNAPKPSPKLFESRPIEIIEKGDNVPKPSPKLFESRPIEIIEKGDNAPNKEVHKVVVHKVFQKEPSNRPSQSDRIEVDLEQGDKEGMGHTGVDVKEGDKEFVYGHRFQEAEIDPKQPFIEFLKWNAFERGLFQLNPRIEFIIREHEGNYRYILKSFMVLKLLGVRLCKYPVERLEIPENYSKGNELFNFLRVLSRNDGFVTDKMRGRYERSLTLLEIAEGVGESDGYRIETPMDERFVVAGC